MADVNITVGVALDQLNASINSIKSQFSALGDTIKSVIAAGGLGLFIEKMAELGEQTERSAAILGVSTEAAQELGVIAQISGGSLEAITTQLTRLQVGLERGAKETSVQAQALKALGISAQQFISTPVDKQMNLLADAVKRLHDQGINAAPALAMISRGLAQMMPELVRGSGGMDELRQRAIDMGAIVSDQTTKALVEMNTDVKLLWDSLKGLGETIAAAVSPAFRTLATTIGTAAGNLSALIATGKIGPYLWDALKTGVMGASAAFLGDAEAMEEVRKKEEALGNQLGDIVKKYHDMIAAAAAASGLKPIRVDVLGVDRDAIKIAEENFKEQSELIKQLADAYAISEETKTAMLINQLAIRRDAEIKARENVQVAWAKYNADIEKMDTEATKKIMNDWKQVADTFASNFSSALDQVLSKQATFGQAMLQMFGKMIEEMIAWVVKLIAEWIILDIVSGGTATLGGVMSGMGGFGGALASALKLQHGTPLVPQTGFAMLHEGEAVIPSWENPAAGGGTGGGGGSVVQNTFGGGGMSLNISAVDARSFAAMLMNNQSPLSIALRNMVRRNPSLFSGFAQHSA